jgi:hypothetical protein
MAVAAMTDTIRIFVCVSFSAMVVVAQGERKEPGFGNIIELLIGSSGPSQEVGAMQS